MYLAGGSRPGGALPQRQPGRRRPAVHPAGTIRPPTSSRRQRRLPARHRRRRPGGPGGPAGRRDASCSAASATAGSSGPTSAWSFDGGSAWTTAFSATWEGSAGLPDARRRQLPRARRDGRADVRLRRQRARPARARRAPATHRPIPLAPGYCTLSMLFSDWDRSGRRDLRVTQRPRTTTTTARSSSGGSRPASRRASTRPRTAGSAADLGHGHRQLRPDRRRLSRTYFLTSQGDNKLQTLTAGPGQPTYRDIALKRGVTAAQPFTGGDVPALDRLAPGVRGRQQRRLRRPVRLQGQRQRRCPTSRRRTPATCCSASPTARSSKAPTRPASSNFDRGRGAALADFNLDGLLDLVEVNLRRTGQALAQRRARATAATPAADGPLARAPARPDRARTATRSARGSRSGRRHRPCAGS